MFKFDVIVTLPLLLLIKLPAMVIFPMVIPLGKLLIPLAPTYRAPVMYIFLPVTAVGTLVSGKFKIPL